YTDATPVLHRQRVREKRTRAKLRHSPTSNAAANAKGSRSAARHSR
ncbi:unnamed protein product, partial [Cuscuta campestris]